MLNRRGFFGAALAFMLSPLVKTEKAVAVSSKAYPMNDATFGSRCYIKCICTNHGEGITSAETLDVTMDDLFRRHGNLLQRLADNPVDH